MAARFCTEEVVNMVLESDGESDSESEELLSEEERYKGELSQLLTGFKKEDKDFNHRFFYRTATQVLLPLMKLARQPMTSTDQSINEFILSSRFPCAPVLRRECEFWLKCIYRRLAGRVSVKSPHFIEILRALPAELFGFLSRLVSSSKERLLCEPHCYQSKNKKGEVISFTCIQAVKTLFSILSGKEKNTLNHYFKRQIYSGKRVHHKLSLLVSESKDFAFVYRFKKEELTISFHYAEWNAFGCPQHS